MPNQDDEQILQSWREFLAERLGGIEMSWDELSEHLGDLMTDAMRERIKADPSLLERTRVSPLRMRTMTDDEMCSSQGPIFEFFGYALSIPDHVVIMRELLPVIKPEASLLDVGWKPCFFSAFLQSQGLLKTRTVGVTPSEESIRRLLEIVGEDRVFMELKHGSPLDLPFADGEFGQVISVDLLHWLHGWRKAISEIARVAAEGASIFISLVSYSVRNGEIDVFTVAQTLAKHGVDVRRFDTFSAEKSQSPRLFVTGVKGKPKRESRILIPGETDY